MDAKAAREALLSLLDDVPVASLATAHEEGPRATLAPFVALREPLRMYLFTSALAAHTAALARGGLCGVLVHRAPTAGDARDNHALARVSLRVSARGLSREEARAEGAEEAWRSRFPAMAPTLLGLGDFQFTRLDPVEATLVLGFGNAWRGTGEGLSEWQHQGGAR